jgi:hypothetical protein
MARIRISLADSSERSSAGLTHVVAFVAIGVISAAIYCLTVETGRLSSGANF